jgi:hypothetical protein
VGEVGLPTDEGGDDEPVVACTDPAYGNGVCDLDTTCDVVDVDCFVTFDTPDSAKAWFDASGQAANVGASLPVSDARHAPTQALIDEGWEAYKKVFKVGELADERVQLVLIDNSSVNAFAMGDKDRVRAGLAMMVNTGLIDANAPKAQVLGVIMHEFHHAMALHVNPTVKERMIKYYKAPAGSEPIGNRQADDPAVRAHFDAWTTYGEWAGWASDVEFAGLPMLFDVVKSSRGLAGYVFKKLILERVAANPTTACTTSANAFMALHTRLIGLERRIDNGFTLAAAESQNVITATTNLRNDCFGTAVTGDAITHMARLLSIPEAPLRESFPADLKAEIEGKTVITGLHNSIQVARTKMRELEAASAAQLGVSWDRVRYFTTEEDADDASARIMLEMGLAVDGGSQLLIGTDPALSSVCMPMLSSGSVIPYGEKLTDDHHATCWRASHQQLVGVSASGRQLPSWGPLGPEPRTPLLERIGAGEALREIAH